MIYVCDAIMGTGKSSAAISYMNENPDKKFIYITPFLDEANRIATGCKSVHFYEPKQKKEYHGSKTLHTIDLVRNGKNVATTHQAFRYYPIELLDLIREQHYTLIIDESVDVLESVELNADDVELAIKAGYIAEKEPGILGIVKSDYSGTAFKNMFKVMRSRDLIRVRNRNRETFFYWQLPPDLITSFDDVFVLTYLFDGQDLHHFMMMYDLPFEYIGIADPTKAGVYRFSWTEKYVPPYVKDLPDKIHFMDREKLNDVGRGYHDLSLNWFRRNGNGVTQLKNNLYNYFTNIAKVESGFRGRMWSTYKEAERKIRGRGYSKSYTPFNIKATNQYRDRSVVAYCANLFMNVGQKLFYTSHGVEIDEDVYALSIMVQCIWRSAIRDGKEIELYIPSSRMRIIFKKWIQSVSGRDVYSSDLDFKLRTSYLTK